MNNDKKQQWNPCYKSATYFIQQMITLAKDGDEDDDDILQSK